jgi:tetrahydromethanopterin S-methyltransferase subunit C
MAVFLVAGAIIGILLGLRFKVLVLVPASILAAVVIILSKSGNELSVIVLTLVGTLVSLQIGYLAGGLLRYLLRAHLPAWTRCRRSGTN